MPTIPACATVPTRSSLRIAGLWPRPSTIRWKRSSGLARSRSTLLHQRGRALADFFELHFKATKAPPGLSSENTLFICPECFRKAETMRSLPCEVRATIRMRRSSAVSTRLTRPFATSRSTAILIEPGVRSTIGPIVLTGKGPLCNKTSNTAKSERPSPVSPIPTTAYLVRARIAFIITSQTWSVP